VFIFSNALQLPQLASQLPACDRGCDRVPTANLNQYGLPLNDLVSHEYEYILARHITQS